MTLILNGTDNSATTPAVTGTDTDTGIYYPTSNQVAIATNGTQAMLVNASQNTTFAGTVTANTVGSAAATSFTVHSAGTTALTLSTAQNATFAGTLATAAKGITAASLPAGTVLQTVSTTLNTYGSTGSQNYVLVGGLSVAITPATTSNKVLIRGYIWLSGSTQNGMYGAVFRGGSILAGVAGSAAQPSAIVNGTVGTVTASGGFIPASGYVTYQATPICFEFLDSPASTSSLTYQIGVRVGGGGVVYFNYQSNTGGNPDFGYFASTITAMEIVA